MRIFTTDRVNTQDKTIDNSKNSKDIRYMILGILSLAFIVLFFYELIDI